MNQCVNDVVAFGMNSTEIRIAVTVGFIAVILYFYKLILRTTW